MERGRKTRLRGAVTAAALLVLASAGAAQAGERCTWDTKSVPLFMGAPSPTVQGGTTQTQGSTVILPFATYRYTSWKIVMRPGYMYGRAEAWEDMAYDAFMTGCSQVSRGAARGGIYDVCKRSDCAAPARIVTARAYVAFKLAAETEGPAQASVYGMTSVIGSNTGVQSVAAGAAAAGDGASTTVNLKLNVGKAVVQIPVQLSYGSDVQTKSLCAIDVKTAAMPDEEYFFQHQIQLDVKADSDFMHWWSRGKSRLYRHTFHVETWMSCRNCGEKDFASVLITAPEPE